MKVAEGMMKLFTRNGLEYELNNQINSGGEGLIYDIVSTPDLIAKLYKKQPLALVQQDKLQALSVKTPIADTAHPVELLYGDKSCKQLKGYLMPYAEGKVLANFNNPSSRRQVTGFKYHPSFFLNTIHSLLKVVEDVHSSGMIIGDVNDANILVRPNGEVTVIDVDSFQVESFPCTVAREEFLSPDLQGQSLKQILRAPEHDMFAVSVIMWQLLFNGIHPFSGSGSDSLTDNIKSGICIGHSSYKPPKRQHPYEKLPADVQSLFIRTFQLKSVAISEWISALHNHEKVLSKFIKQANQLKGVKVKAQANKVKTRPTAKTNRSQTQTAQGKSQPQPMNSGQHSGTALVQPFLQGLSYVFGLVVLFTIAFIVFDFSSSDRDKEVEEFNSIVVLDEIENAPSKVVVPESLNMHKKAPDEVDFLAWKNRLQVQDRIDRNRYGVSESQFGRETENSTNFVAWHKRLQIQKKTESNGNGISEPQFERESESSTNFVEWQKRLEDKFKNVAH